MMIPIVAEKILFLFFVIIIQIVLVLLVDAQFRHISRTTKFISCCLLCFTNIVLISQISNFFTLINAKFFLIVYCILLACVWLLWRHSGKPSLSGPFSEGKWTVWRELPFIKTKPALYLLAIGIVIIYLGNAILIITTPQHTYDSMTYHLSRVGYWLQHGTLAPWFTPNPRQTTFPPNAELGSLWTVLFWGSDQLTGFVQWFSALAASTAIFGIARLLGANRKYSLFAALIWLSYPAVLLQSTTTQNDLVISAFFIIMLYFLFLGLKEQKSRYLLLSGVAFGLAFGTKTTIFFTLPGLGISIFLLYRICRVKKNDT